MPRITISKDSKFAVQSPNGDITVTFGNSKQPLVKTYKPSMTFRPTRRVQESTEEIAALMQERKAVNI